MKTLLLISLGLISFAADTACAGILGKYKIKGKENNFGYKYGFHGTISIKNYRSGFMKIYYSPVDSSSVWFDFKTPLKETKKEQTVRISWSANGEPGTGRATFKGVKDGYEVEFKYLNGGLSGAGRGSKSR